VRHVGHLPGIVDLVNHAGGDHSEDGRERADAVNKMSHGRGLKVITSALACEREEIATENMIVRCWR
jgi:hypothetical protein